MANINDGDLISLIGSSGSNTGFQKAHIIGSNFADTAIKWFGKLFGANGVDDPANIIPLPETTQGGATMGVAVHRGLQVNAFDSLFYDPINQGSTKFLNTLERQIEAKLEARGLRLKDIDSPAAADIAFEYKIKVRNFLDFAKCLFMGLRCHPT